MHNKITVTSPSLPDLKDFTKSLEQIWDNKWLTNAGPFHQELENKLATYLGVPYISLFSNGTLGLITAIQALQLEGEIITTPYSFVATAHSIWWNKLKPVFVDTDPVYGNLCPEKIEAAITPNTTAIMPVHVYGHPCELEKIKLIAEKYNLKIIYDAAHAFGVKYNGESILNWGDLSVLSFHATKVFNTIEGGAIVSHTAEMKKHIDYLKNFGFEDETTVMEIGINAKMNEIQAAFGLLQLEKINENINKRKEIYNHYHQELSKIKGIGLISPKENVTYNYSYYPILVDEKEYGMTRDELYFYLQKNNIFARRYFYPLITAFEPYKNHFTKHFDHASKIADKVICLPMYADLTESDVKHIINIIKQ